VVKTREQGRGEGGEMKTPFPTLPCPLLTRNCWQVGALLCMLGKGALSEHGGVHLVAGMLTGAREILQQVDVDKLIS